MKVDIYTKTVLSVIAVCLVILTLGSVDILPSANANPMPQSGNLKTNYDGSINVKIIGIDSGVNAMPVQVKNSSVQVKVDTYNTIPVAIKSVSPTLDVNVKNSYIYTKNY